MIIKTLSKRQNIQSPPAPLNKILSYLLIKENFESLITAVYTEALFKI